MIFGFYPRFQLFSDFMTTRASPTPTSLTSYTSYILVELRQVQKKNTLNMG